MLAQLEELPVARPSFQTNGLSEQWKLPRVSPSLRFVVIVTDMIYREHGAARMRLLRLIDKEAPYCYGIAADVSVLELPGVRCAGPKMHFLLPDWICKRLNLLFPYGDGDISTAAYDGTKIMLRVPTAGFRPDSCALSEWAEWGATGRRILTPRKVRI
jgi:hypothetical protein